MSSLSYVTIEEAKCQCRVPSTDGFDDGRFFHLIQAASGAVKNYLKDFSAYEGQRNTDDDYEVDSSGEPVLEEILEVKPEVKQAVLLLIDDWYNGRMPEDPHSLPPYVSSLLWPLRDPACR